jgi:hypothetical protein
MSALSNETTFLVFFESFMLVTAVAIFKLLILSSRLRILLLLKLG